MTLTRLTFLYGLLALVLTACNREVMNPVEYVNWVRDAESGLMNRKEFDPYYFEVLYRPLDYVVLSGMDPESLDRAVFEQKRKDSQGVVYMEIRFGSLDGGEFLRTGISEMSEYYGRLEYFTGAVGSDLMLVRGADTSRCVMHHFERSYGLTPYNTLMVGFEGEERVDNHTLIYRDRVLGTGPLRFTIGEDAIGRLPKLTFKI